MDKFDMEDAAKKAMNAWDREHGDEPEHKEEEGCGDASCVACNKEMTIEEINEGLLKEKLVVSIVRNPSGDEDDQSVGTVVDLPSTKQVAEIMLITIVRTMALAAGETPEDVMMKLADNLKKGLVKGPSEYEK